MSDVGDGAAGRWIEGGDLLKLVQRDVQIAGDETPEVVLTHESKLLVAVTEAAMPPLDLGTYRIRLQRWQEGQGPRLTGIQDFVHALETLDAPARAATVRGRVTTYAFLLDVDLSRVLAAVAVDAPGTA